MNATRQPPYGGGDILMTVAVIVIIGFWIPIILATQVWHTDIAPLPANGSNIAP